MISKDIGFNYEWTAENAYVPNISFNERRSFQGFNGVLVPIQMISKDQCKLKIIVLESILKVSIQLLRIEL
jgi:hypothetical protein